jgi:protocatechuate 3,4-dioxygenase beta subunit
MQPTRLLAILLVLSAVAAAAMWWLGGDEVVPPAPTGALNAPPAAGAPAASANGQLAPAGAEGPGGAAAVREAVPVAPSEASGRSVFGKVVDDAGQPVVGAIVTAWAGRGTEFDPTGPDAAEQFRNFDPQALAERLRERQDQRLEVPTAADGTFRIALTGDARAQPLRVRARGHRLLDHTVRIARGQTGDIDAGTLALVRGAVVSGRVVDPTGAGVAAAKVTAQPGGGGGRGGPFGGGMDLDLEVPGMDRMMGLFGDEATTDADGRFELAHVEPGQVSLRARHPDHPNARRDGVEVRAGAQLVDIVVALEAGATIAGKVVDVPAGVTGLRVIAAAVANERAAADGNDAGLGMFGDIGAMVADFGAIGERTVEVAADGSFLLRGLRPGRPYRVNAVQQGRGFVDVAVCSQRLELRPPSAAVELRYDAGVRVTFRVVDARTKAPIEQLWIDDRLRGGNGIEAMMAMAPRGGRERAGSYPDGRVVLANLRPKAKQTLSIDIEALAHQKQTRTDLVLPSSGELDLGVIALEPAPVLKVLVTAAEGGAPVRGANVRVRARNAQPAAAGGNPLEEMAARLQGGGSRPARTDGDGRCVLNLPAGAPIVVSVDSRDFAPFQSEPLSPGIGSDVELPVSLLRGGSVVVRVVGADGKAVAEARVERAGPGGDRDQRISDASGAATFERLAPGQHQFRLTVRGAGGGQDFAAMAARLGGGGEAAPTGPGWQAVAVADGERSELQLEQQPTAQLRGFVRDQGQAVAGARIQFVSGEGGAQGGGELADRMAQFGGGGRGRSVRSGADGSFELKNLPAGNHRLRVSIEGWAMPNTVPLVLGFDDNVVDVALERTVVRGVVRGPDGAPVAGASVSVGVVRPPAGGDSDPMTAAVESMVPGGLDAFTGGGSSVRSGDDGSFELVGVQSGVLLRVRASAKGFAGAIAEPFQLPAGGVRQDLVLALTAAGKVEVTSAETGGFFTVRAVLLDASGQPVPGVAPAGERLRRGRATLDGLRSGRWRIELMQLPPTGTPASREVEVVAGQTSSVAF